MKAVITGINGFIGSNLARRLLAEGWEVSGVVRAESDLAFIRGCGGLRVSPSGLGETGAITRAFDGADVVFHCAARASDWGPMKVFREANVENTDRVMRAALEAGVRRVVHLSSTVVYGFGGHVDTGETAPFRPAPFPYCVTKRLAEERVAKIGGKVALESVIVRPGNVFGPRDRVTSVPLFGALQAGRFAFVGGGKALTCPVYVENLADALLLAGTRPGAAGEDFIVTDGLRVTWREYIAAICAALGARNPTLSFPAGPAYAAAALAEGLYKFRRAKSPPLITRYRVSQVARDYHFSIAKARRVLGFEPRVGLDEGIRRTVAWYRERSSPPPPPPPPPAESRSRPSRA